jgi:exosortase family protein XrtF
LRYQRGNYRTVCQGRDGSGGDQERSAGFDGGRCASKTNKYMSAVSLSEFRPTIWFLVRFIGIYLLANLAYGMYVDSFEPKADPITHEVTEETASLLHFIHYDVTIRDHDSKATTSVSYRGHTIVSVYEGCNGINIFIVFIAFVLAFGPYHLKMLSFIPAGVIVLHAFNLLRIAGLFLITIHRQQWTYFVHKYLFTAFIYAIVFLLWLLWVSKFSKQRQ